MPIRDVMVGTAIFGLRNSGEGRTHRSNLVSGMGIKSVAIVGKDTNRVATVAAFATTDTRTDRQRGDSFTPFDPAQPWRGGSFTPTVGAPTIDVPAAIASWRGKAVLAQMGVLTAVGAAMADPATPEVVRLAWDKRRGHGAAFAEHSGDGGANGLDGRTA